MHSHSCLERELELPKRFVLVDAEYASRFLDDTITKVVNKNVTYYKVPILEFVMKGGVFKNLNR